MHSTLGEFVFAAIRMKWNSASERHGLIEVMNASSSSVAGIAGGVSLHYLLDTQHSSHILIEGRIRK